jgi:hypothetical protein
MQLYRNNKIAKNPLFLGKEILAISLGRIA